MPKPPRYCMGPGWASDPKPCPHGKQFEMKGPRKRCDDCMIEHKRETLRGRTPAAKLAFKRRTRQEVWKQITAPRYQMPNTSKWRCKRCGCTERVACFPFGCWWVGKELCSSARCATAEDHFIHAMATRLNQLPALFNGVFKLPADMALHKKGPEDIAEKKAWKESQRETLRRAREAAAEKKLRTHKKRKRRHGRAPKAALDPKLILKTLKKRTGTKINPLAARLHTNPYRLLHALDLLIQQRKARMELGPMGTPGARPRLFFKA